MTNQKSRNNDGLPCDWLPHQKLLQQREKILARVDRRHQNSQAGPTIHCLGDAKFLKTNDREALEKISTFIKASMKKLRHRLYAPTLSFIRPDLRSPIASY